jgi:RHS repeat-associated protein
MDRRYAMNKLGAVLLLAGVLLTPARAETVTYLHTDLLGSVVLETDQNRNVVARYEYEPYGLPRQAIADQPGYTGHVHDAGSGLVYMQQRYYDPEVGRFLSVDPVGVDTGTGGNFNRYWYGNNNPYRYVDPDGRMATHVARLGWVIGSGINKVAVQVAGVSVSTILVDALWNALHNESEGEGSIEPEPRGEGVRSPQDAVDLEEALAVDEIVGTLEAGGGEDFSDRMSDPRYAPQTGTHDKVRESHSHPDGTVTEVHADRDRNTGALSDVKIKDAPDNKKSRGN